MKQQIGMMPIFLVAFLFFILSPSTHAQETSADFGAGSVTIGPDTRTCTGALEGAIRYNASGSSCGTGETLYSGSCYEKFTTTVNWTTAEANCVTWGGHLVSLNDAAEDSWVHTNMSVGTTNTWIGFNDQDVEGTWIWSDGSSNTYDNWGSTQPDNADGGIEHEAHYWSSESGKWNDNYYNNSYQYICEKSAGTSACIEVCDGSDWICRD